MTLNRGLLSRIDAGLRSELDHAEGVQLVKVPVSDAVWSTWRRYCDLVGIPMGRALAILLHKELASVADEDLEGLSGRIEAREAEAEIRARALAQEEKDVERRRRDLVMRESELAERQRDLEAREKNVAVVEHEVAQVLIGMTQTPTSTRSVPKLGRNEPCWCGSEKKYKNCHLRQDS